MSEYSNFLSEENFAIFLFHGVIREQRHQIRNYTKKHLDENTFARVIRELKNNGTPVSMPNIVAATLNRAQLPPKAFAITFDDGFENNYSVAAPILRDLNVPCTFYVTTGFVEVNGLSWIDKIEAVVEQTDCLRLDLPYPELTGTFQTREQKIDLLNHIRRIVKGDRRIEPDEFAGEVARQSGASTELDEQLDHKMSWRQVRELHEDELFTIGGHGHTHRILEYLDDAELESEIAVSLNALKENLGGTIEHYSYPEGMSNCYSDRVIRLLRDRGIVCSPTAEDGVNRIGDDLFRLKRIMVN
jgi:peptidoglycan/xylan/chitin deacetylase (PgdA/CDA1 family)